MDSLSGTNPLRWSKDPAMWVEWGVGRTNDRHRNPGQWQNISEATPLSVVSLT